MATHDWESPYVEGLNIKIKAKALQDLTRLVARAERAEARVKELEAERDALRRDLDHREKEYRILSDDQDRLEVELAEEKARYRWLPIAEIHEDYGQCVLVHIDDPGYMEIGSNLDTHFEEDLWTHFAPVPRMSHEDGQRMEREAIDAARLNGQTRP